MGLGLLQCSILALLYSRVDSSNDHCSITLMANKTVSFRLPTELVEAIDAQAKATGQSKTSVVIAALAKSYGYQHSLPRPIILKQFQQQLNELQHQKAILSAANKLEKLLTSPVAPIKLGPEVDAIISSMPLENRLAWVYGVLEEAAWKELMLQTIEPAAAQIAISS